MIAIYPFSQVSPAQVFARPEGRRDVAGTVSAIIEEVRRGGDGALLRYAKEFDHAEITALEVPAAHDWETWQMLYAYAVENFFWQDDSSSSSISGGATVFGL